MEPFATTEKNSDIICMDKLKKSAQRTFGWPIFAGTIRCLISLGSYEFSVWSTYKLRVQVSYYLK